MLDKLIDLTSYPVQPVLNILLKDKTTGENIIFATDNYAEFGQNYSETSKMLPELLVFGGRCLIEPRVTKEAEAQLLRQRSKAEVFTPSWICDKMNNHCDEEWFGYENVFNKLEEHNWTTREEKIAFPDGKTWQEYVDSRRIEITCGEAPYLVSRYDAATGEKIEIKDRIGMLDRKLRIVNENAESDEDWLNWAVRAFQSVYGYEYQGDNLLIARINLLITFTDYYEARFGTPPDTTLLRKVANIISWNIWQMDGITGTIPFGTPEKENTTAVDDDFWAAEFGFYTEETSNETPPCKIYDWRSDRSINYNDLKRGS